MLTLLVLELVPRTVRSPIEVPGDRPTSPASLTAFVTIGSVWLDHNEAFSRVTRLDPIVLLLLNLAVLLGASLVPYLPVFAAFIAARFVGTDRAAGQEDAPPVPTERDRPSE